MFCCLEIHTPTSLSTLPNFLTWLAHTAVMMVIFARVYMWMTPWDELSLIRQGNIAAAMSFCGSIIGYTLVLASLLLHAVNSVDFLIWAIVGLAVQIAVLVLARFVMGADLNTRMHEGQNSSGLFIGALSLAAGILNAAAMTY